MHNKARRLCASLNSRLESNKEEEDAHKIEIDVHRIDVRVYNTCSGTQLKVGENKDESPESMHVSMSRTLVRRLIDSGLVGSTEGYDESRRCSWDTYPDFYITKYTSI